MKQTRYLVGLFVITAVCGFIIIRPLSVLIYPHLPFMGILKRGLTVILLCAFLCLYRILKGPGPSDRITGMDMLGILIMGICALLSISTKRTWYIDIAIAWGLQSFISTLAFTKFFEGKDFDE
jgi:multicomponent Na+:H+ antiporter subunit F